MGMMISLLAMGQIVLRASASAHSHLPSAAMVCQGKNKQTNKQTDKQTNKQTTKRTNERTKDNLKKRFGRKAMERKKTGEEGSDATIFEMDDNRGTNSWRIPKEIKSLASSLGLQHHTFSL
jgi:hypothetical protein